MTIDLAIIGGGPAGLAAAIEAKKHGAGKVVIFERLNELGGILPQCIHTGFGLIQFGEELSGPEYAHRFIQELKNHDIEVKLETMVIDISSDKVVTYVNSSEGIQEVYARSVVLAMGSRERTRGILNIPGSRPAGIYTAGTAQRFVNMEGYLPGKKIVILGSGDIGLIMARRLTLEGAKVEMVLELLPYSAGLTRNIVQCLHDFDIPLKLEHTVVEIIGKERLEGVVIAQVDENRIPIPDTFKTIECDTLLLSAGLIPENELSRGMKIELNPITKGPNVNESMETSLEGVFACGNVVHVHDLVDFVTQEAKLAGRRAAMYLSGLLSKENLTYTNTIAGSGVRYIVPQSINIKNLQEENKLFFRSDNVYENAKIEVYSGQNLLACHKKARISPGEMESIPIDSKMADSISSADLTIKISV